MTREEAIKILNKYDLNFCDIDGNPIPPQDLAEAVYMAVQALEKEPIIYCKDCKHWHEWENGTGSCHRSDIMWVGSDYDDYCSFAEKRGSDGE